MGSQILSGSETMAKAKDRSMCTSASEIGRSSTVNKDKRTGMAEPGKATGRSRPVAPRDAQTQAAIKDLEAEEADLTRKAEAYAKFLKRATDYVGNILAVKDTEDTPAVTFKTDATASATAPSGSLDGNRSSKDLASNTSKAD